MTRKTIILMIFGIVFTILTWLFVGIYRDDEFYDPHLFIKYRPTFKISFHSPTGMQDLDLNDLSPNKRTEEKAFQDFVIEQRIQNNDNPRLWYLPLILLQLALTFLSFGIESIRRTFNYKQWQIPLHFLICGIFTSVGLGLILVLDNLLVAVFGGFIILAINFFTVVLQTRRTKSLTEEKAINNDTYKF